MRLAISNRTSNKELRPLRRIARLVHRCARVGALVGERRVANRQLEVVLAQLVLLVRHERSVVLEPRDLGLLSLHVARDHGRFSFGRVKHLFAFLRDGRRR